MGADFCVTGVPAFDVTPQRLHELAAVIDGLTEVDFAENRPARADALAEWRDGLREAVAILDGIEGLRDVSRWYEWWLSGGMSYGDDPTESYTRLSLIHDCDALMEKVLAWSKLDNMAKTTV